ncbi:hypothetical protein BX616_010777 [Lobosporangium transversale]|nr:hypothetical protein BX616_010777 [Lobosporangium transversale]
MDQAVFLTVVDTLSANFSTRAEAKLRLKELELKPDYPLSLVKLVLTRDCDISLRQSAATLLEAIVDSQWSVKDAASHSSEPPAEIKTVFHDLVLTGLSDPIAVIRTSCANIICKIAHSDWPDCWTDLLDILAQILKSGTAEGVDGSMQVLTEFFSKDVTHAQMPAIASMLFPELFRVLISDRMYSFVIRSQCVLFFRNAIEMLHTLKSEYPEAVTTFLTPIFGQWNDAFLNILNIRTTNISEVEDAEWSLKTEILKSMNIAIQGFPKLTLSYTLPVLSVVWQDLVILRAGYFQEHTASSINQDRQPIENINEKATVFTIYLRAQLDFLQMICRRRKQALVGQNRVLEIIHRLVQSILPYTQMTDKQIEGWHADPNKFISDEDDDSSLSSIRFTAKETLSAIVGCLKDQAIQALSMSINEGIERTLQERAAGDPNWWKLQEACLLATGLISEELCSKATAGEFTTVDTGKLFEHIIMSNLYAHDYPFLQGRSFVLASQFSSITPTSLIPQCVSATVGAILNTPSAIVKVSALKTLNNFYIHLDKNYVLPYQRSIIQGITPLIEITTKDVLSLVIRTLTTTCKLETTVTAEFETLLGPLALEVWSKYSVDNISTGTMLSSDVKDLLDVLAANPYINSALIARALPVLTEIVSVHNPEKDLIKSAIDLLSRFVQGSPSPLMPGFVAQFFGNLMSVLLISDDSRILQDVHQIANWCDSDSESTGLNLLMKFIARLLNPSQDEPGAILVGELISKLIKNGGNMISPILPEMLNAVAFRLASARVPLFIQSLVMVFAYLFLDQQGAQIDFLSAMTIDGRTGLDVVLTSWLLNHVDFQGVYYQKLSTVALTKAFIAADPRMLAIHVKGDMIVTNSSRRMTRSKAKTAPTQYAMITAPVKIVKLLIADLTIKIEDETLDDIVDDKNGYAEHDEDDGEEDDDDEGNIERERKDELGIENSLIKQRVKGDGVVFLSDQLPRRFFDTDKDDGYSEEPDLKADLIFQLNLKEFLIEFFRQQANSPLLKQCVQDLNDNERQTLFNLLN